MSTLALPLFFPQRKPTKKTRREEQSSRRAVHLIIVRVLGTRHFSAQPIRGKREGHEQQGRGGTR